MNLGCPLCSFNLSRKRLKKVPLKGESSWLALRWYLECPNCKGALQLNQHPKEQAIVSGLLGGVAILNVCAYLSGYKASGSMALATFALILIGPFLLRAVLVPTEWSRYARHLERL